MAASLAFWGVGFFQRSQLALERCEFSIYVSAIRTDASGVRSHARGRWTRHSGTLLR